eukprot:gene13526-4408_t
MAFSKLHNCASVLITFAPGLMAAIFYGFTSGSMSFINKYVLSSFGYKYVDVLMLAQLVITSTVLEICRLCNFCDIPAWSMERGKSFFVPSICFAAHTTLALAALGNLSIPVLVGVVKSVLTTLIGFFTFGGVPVSFFTIMGVGLNTFGGALYSYAKYLEKRSVLRSISNLFLPTNASDVAEKGNEVSNEKGTHDSVSVTIDDRTRA